MQETIKQIVIATFSPEHLDIQNDSHLHAGESANSHFKVLIVSSAFTDMKSLKRHQSVYKALKEVMKEIHALQLNTYSPTEWQQKVSDGSVNITSSKCAHS